MTTQLDLFNEAKVSVGEPEPMTEVRIGSRVARIPLRKKRREALTRLMEILSDLEGEDVYIGSYHEGAHFRIDNLKLPRLRLEFYPWNTGKDQNYIPSVVGLSGRRGTHVRIYTDYLVAVREQEYMGYWHYLLDFRNGTWEYPLDNNRSHYACLTITKFKD